MGQASVSFFEALRFEFCISGNDNKIVVLLSKMLDSQGFLRKKRPCKIAEQDQQKRTIDKKPPIVG